MKIALDYPPFRAPTLNYPVQCCGNCKFWWCEDDDPNKYLNHEGDDYVSAGAGDFSGECRRFPPQLLAPEDETPDTDSPRWREGWHPTTGTWQWCGEYQHRRPEAEAPAQPDA